MSFSVFAVSQSHSQFEVNVDSKAAPKATVVDEIKQLAEQGRSEQQIATAVGLPVAIVASTLGDTTSSSSATSSASALVALSARLSVYS